VTNHVPPAFLRPTRATKPALIGATDLPDPHCKQKTNIIEYLMLK
jgi:hypothetical protein